MRRKGDFGITEVVYLLAIIIGVALLLYVVFQFLNTNLVLQPGG